MTELERTRFRSSPVNFISSIKVLIGSDGTMYPEQGRIAIHKRKVVRYVDLAPLETKVKTDPETYRQYEEFARGLRTTKSAAVSAESAKLAAKIMLLAERSLREHRIMSWNDLPA